MNLFLHIINKRSLSSEKGIPENEDRPIIASIHSMVEVMMIGSNCVRKQGQSIPAPSVSTMPLIALEHSVYNPDQDSGVVDRQDETQNLEAHRGRKCARQHILDGMDIVSSQ